MPGVTVQNITIEMIELAEPPTAVCPERMTRIKPAGHQEVATCFFICQPVILRACDVLDPSSFEARLREHLRITGCREYASERLLAPPSADAAHIGIAGPFLDAGVHGFGVQGIAVPMRKTRPRGAAPLLVWRLGETGLMPGGGPQLGANWRRLDALDGDFPGVVPCQHAGYRIALGLDRDRREGALGPERRRRQHRLGKIEAQELIRLVVSRRGCAARDQGGAENSAKNTFQDHSGLLKTTPRRSGDSALRFSEGPCSIKRTQCLT